MATNQVSRNQGRPERVRTAFLRGNSFGSISVLVLLISCICLRSANGRRVRRRSVREAAQRAGRVGHCRMCFHNFTIFRTQPNAIAY